MQRDSEEGREMTHRTARAIVHKFGPACGSYETNVPEGTRVEPITDEPGFYWVAEFGKLEPFARHDAEHYGIRIKEEDVRRD